MSQENHGAQGAPGTSSTAGLQNRKQKTGLSGKWTPWIALGACVVIGGAIAAYYYVYSLSHKSTDDAFIDGHVVAVAPRVSGHVTNVCVAANQPVEKGQLLVELDPRDFEARLDSAVAALGMAQANAEAAGIDLELTKVTATAGYDEATSGVSSAKSSLNTSQARASASKSALAQAQAEVAVANAVALESSASGTAAEAVEKRDALDLHRYADLLKSNSITSQEFDHASAAAATSSAQAEAARRKAAADAAGISRAEAALASAEDAVREAEFSAVESEAGVDQAKARLVAADTAKQKISASEAKVRIAQAAVRQAAAAVEEARLALSYTRLYAPAAGRVTHKTVETGAYVQTGQALLAIVQSDLWVVANFKETQLTQMRPGQPVKIYVDAFPDKVFSGRLDSIQAGTGAAFSLLPPENATGNYIKVVQRLPVKIVFDEPVDETKYFLAPGMSVVPEVDVSAPGEGRQWPAAAVSTDSTAARE